MKFERAKESDLPVIGEILAAAREYLRTQGLDQWQKYAPTAEDTAEHFRRGEQYVLRDGTEIAGVCAVVPYEPAYDRIDGAWRQSGAYLAIHRVAAAPDVRRRGVASALFYGAETLARAQGICALRIDTHEGNLPMRGALEKNGFIFCGTVTIATGERRVGYEKILNEDGENVMKESENRVTETIVAATGNAHKLREIRAIFADKTVLSEKEAGFSGEVEETGESFLENALLKARAVCRATGQPALADDSGIVVDALGGAPGVHSARYASKDEKNSSDESNRALLLRNLQGEQNRRAWFTSAVALVFPDGREVTAEGHTFGRILDKETGEGGFGYDCLFFSDDLQKSFGEATSEEKNAVSHRGRALEALAAKLEEQR